jgi:hypothetical protein
MIQRLQLGMRMAHKRTESASARTIAHVGPLGEALIKAAQAFDSLTMSVERRVGRVE